MRQLYNHRGEPIADISTTLTNRGKPAVRVQYGPSHWHKPDRVILMDDFEEWKQSVGLRELEDMEKE